MRAHWLGSALAICVTAQHASAATIGYVMEFNDGLGDWGGGSSSYTNVPSDGVGGAGDGFLMVANTRVQQLGVRTSSTEFFCGNLLDEGVSGYSFWLKDVGGDDALEIHVGVGNSFSNFWQSTQAFIPGTDWTQFSIDLDPANFVQIIGSGSFNNAIRNCDRLLFRHDVAPFDQIPDSIQADFGIDRVKVLPEPNSLLLLTGALLWAARGRR